MYIIVLCFRVMGFREMSVNLTENVLAENNHYTLFFRVSYLIDINMLGQKPTVFYASTLTETILATQISCIVVSCAHNANTLCFPTLLQETPTSHQHHMSKQKTCRVC